MEITIRAGAGAGRYWREVWAYRELLWFLTWRDLLIRYKQTAVGIAWAGLRPLLSLLALTFVFGRIANLPSEGAPYPVFVLAALLPWQFFSNALSESGMSLLNNANLVSKVYFPRMIVPATSVLTALIDFAVSIAMLAALMMWYGYMPSPRVACLPIFILLTVCCSMGAGLWVSALIIRFRDVRMLLPFVVQLMFFLSPIGYSTALIPERWRVVYFLNPVAGIVDGFRWSILQQTGGLYSTGLFLSAAVSLFLVISGAFYFRRVERNLADVL